MVEEGSGRNSESTSMSEPRSRCFSLLFDLFGFGSANHPDPRQYVAWPWQNMRSQLDPAPAHEMGYFCRPLVQSKKDAAHRRYLHRHPRGIAISRSIVLSLPPRDLLAQSTRLFGFMARRFRQHSYDVRYSPMPQEMSISSLSSLVCDFAFFPAVGTSARDQS